jgi:tRNA threonylcarbamoyladenosine biosynthesis protein TsaB
MGEPMILAVETATRRGSVCLMRRDELVSSAIGEDQSSSHSNTLLREINRVLEQGQTRLSEVSLFAAATGPGSFTGLRIGLASIKAFGATLSRPCVGVPTLEAVARAAGPSNTTVALLPAGRGELFTQMFAVALDETVTELDQPAHLSPVELFAKYGHQPRICWCGEGARSRRKEIQAWADQQGISFSETPIAAKQEGWWLAPQELMLARHVAALAQLRHEQGDPGDANCLRALYVRPSDAELKTNGNNRAGN